MNSRGNIRTPIIIWIVLSVIFEVAYYFLAPILAQAGAIPPIASNTSAEAYSIMQLFTYLAIPVFLGVVTFLFYSLATFTSRERPTAVGPNVRGNPRLLTTWLVASFVLVTVLYVVGFNGLANLEAAAPAEALHVKVTAQQWLFAYTYSDFAANTQSSELYLPVNQPVEFTVTSEDVQHSFWIPELGVKADAVPGETNTFVTTPNKIGNYTVRCMELCGVLHADMNSPVHVVSEDDFLAWVQKQQGITGGTGWLAPLRLPEIALLGNSGKRFF
jgi:cytochrome c oxidase subunit II